MHPKSRSIVLGGLAAMGLVMLFNIVLAVTMGGVSWLSYLICLPFLTSGVFAVAHYTKAEHCRVSTSEGVAMGAQAGLVSFLAFTLLLLVFWLASGRPSIWANLQEQLHRNPQFNANTPEAEQAMRLLGSPVFLLGVSIVTVVVYVVTGLIGGVIGAAVFRGDRDAPQDPAD